MGVEPSFSPDKAIESVDKEPGARRYGPEVGTTVPVKEMFHVEHLSD